MRLATFNVHAWTDRSGRPSAGACIEVLRALRLDAVVLQEVPVGAPKTLERAAAELEMVAHLAPASFLGNALLSRAAPSSFEALELHAGQAETRSAFVAELPWEGGALTFAGTHLDHISEGTRLVQLEALLAALDARRGPLILAGDLNALTLADYDAVAMERIRAQRDKNDWEAPLGDVVARLEAGGYVDLWRAGGTGELATCWAGTRVDYVFARRLEQLRVASADHVAATASDHAPVVVELSASS